jgi:hypothetical protein
MGESQSNAVSSDMEAGHTDKADIEPPRRSRGFQIIIEADCVGHLTGKWALAGASQRARLRRRSCN